MIEKVNFMKYMIKREHASCRVRKNQVTRSLPTRSYSKILKWPSVTFSTDPYATSIMDASQRTLMQLRFPDSLSIMKDLLCMLKIRTLVVLILLMLHGR